MAKRTEVEHLATKYGGSYSGDLVMEKCTHLLIEVSRGGQLLMDYWGHQGTSFAHGFH